MNTNNNIYTVVYTAVIVIIVSAVLAFASSSLKERQEANEKAEVISQILTAGMFGEKSEWAAKGNDAIISFYKENVAEAFTVNSLGEKVADLAIENAEVYTVSALKAQNYNIRDNAETALPVYVFNNGTVVVPIYGAGLWGPIWGYLGFESDLKTILGAYFDHESETPGLGGKIKDDPKFRAQFQGKQIDFTDDEPFAIVKGGAPAGKVNAIDAISGATMTSNGLGTAINNWLKAFQGHLGSAAESCCGGEGGCCGEGMEGGCCGGEMSETKCCEEE